MTGRTKWLVVTIVGFAIALTFSAPGPLGGFWGMEISDPEPAGGALAGLIGAMAGNFGTLAAIELGFHATLVIGAVVIAVFVWQILKNDDAAHPQTSPAGA